MDASQHFFEKDASQHWYPEIVHLASNTSFAFIYVPKLSEMI
jgi:hypothetical protein